MKLKRNIIEIDQESCNGCGACVSACAEGAIAIVDGKAQVISDTYCDGLGNCIGECPQDALKIVVREADHFDEQAVARHVKVQSSRSSGPGASCQCPSAAVQQIKPKTGFAAEPSVSNSALSTWPVQLRLVPPHAPFLKGTDLLVASDCTPFAYAGFHRDFLQGRVLLVGCPKLDDQKLYVDKFTEIFKQNDIKSITVVVMEVPCCQAMPQIVKAGLKAAGASVPLETVVVSVGGDIVERTKIEGLRN
jgi:Pyruvate/2-oxoacid:ferredoxin oxidoreductase delta subunit